MEKSFPLNLLADLLDYPKPGTQKAAEECIRQLIAEYPSCAEQLKLFYAFAANTPLAVMEELYTATFDLQPDNCLYAGHHLFGEDSRRGIFMVRLKEFYHMAGFSAGRELPDHIGVILRFLAAKRADQKDRALIEECLIPVLTSIDESLGRCRSHPYRPLMQAMLELLSGQEGSADG